MDITKFHALTTGAVTAPDGESVSLSVRELGTVKVPSGKLGLSDPFLNFHEPLTFEVPAGEYRVVATLADISENGDGSDFVEAYASVVLSDAAVTELVPAEAVFDADEVDEDELPGDDELDMFGIPVENGAVAFADAAASQAMPEDAVLQLYPEDDESPEMFADVVMGWGSAGENVVVSGSGWGEGFYPVMATKDAQGNLVAIHVDLMVVGDPGYPFEEEEFELEAEGELEEGEPEENDPRIQGK